MKVSFDGLRRNIALDFNALVDKIKRLDLQNDLASEVIVLQNSLGCLLACYDKTQQPEDFNDLSNVKLEKLHA